MFGILMSMPFILKAQQMNTPQQTVTTLFVATDARNWEQVKAVFDTQVTLDYSSMNGNPAAHLNPQQIVDAWQGILPGFEYTHHQLGNFMTQVNESKAYVFCYGTATHYLPNVQGNIWTVVGTYEFDLIQNEKGEWLITTMKFNFKYQDGNTALPESAIKNTQK